MRLFFVLRRANIHTDAAASAIFRRNLNRVFHPVPFSVAHIYGFETRRRVGQVLRFVDLDPHYRVGAYHGALATLDTCFRVPYRNFERDVTLLPVGGTGRISAVGGESAHGNQVAVASIYGAEHIALILVCLRGKRWRNFYLTACPLWNGNVKEAAQGFIYGVQILLHDFFALLGVGKTDRLANG